MALRPTRRLRFRTVHGHYEEWVRLVDKLDRGAHAAKVSKMLEKRANIHFHVWEYSDLMRFFSYLITDMGLPLTVELSFLHRSEVIWIFGKA